MNLVQRMLNANAGVAEKAAPERVPNAPWYSHRYGPPSPRVARRRRIFDVIRADRKREQNTRQRVRVAGRIAEIEAVRRVREWEATNGESALGRLIDDGAYTAQDVAESRGIPIFDVADKLGLLTEVS